MGGEDDGSFFDVSLENGAHGGIVGEMFDNKPSKDNVTKKKRLTISISFLFQTFSVPRVIDYLSLDVEGAEELIMAQFPFETHICKIMTIERPSLALQSLLKSKNYHFVQLLVNWGETLWVHASVLSVLDIQTITAITNQEALNRPTGTKPRRNRWNIETGSF